MCVGRVAGIALRKLGVKGVEIRKPEQLQIVSALIIPGGESTTMAKLAKYHNLVCFLFIISTRSNTYTQRGAQCGM